MTVDSFTSDELLSTLLHADPWTAYRTRTDILQEPGNCREVTEARNAVVENPFVKELIKSLDPWFPQSITRHNSPLIPPHVLKLIADLGVRSDDAGMDTVIAQIEGHLDHNLHATRQTLPEKSFRPPSKTAEEWHALPCDSPEIASALHQMGHDSPILHKATGEIAARWLSEEHWFCHFFFVEKQFKAHNAACPMAGLMALDLFSRTSFAEDSALVERCFHPIAFHKDLGKSLYYFGRSKKFWTFKFPFVWYNALYLADVLTRFPQLHSTPAVEELMDWIRGSRAEDGTWKATSVFKPYKDIDFGQKKNPSAWITYLCLRILKQRYCSS